MSKAYVRVDHEVLLSKLHRVRIRGSALKCLRSSLHNRRQFVQIKHIDDKTRKNKSVNSETTIKPFDSTGSVFGSVLFLILYKRFVKNNK